jgi:hypothetical protein
MVAHFLHRSFRRFPSGKRPPGLVPASPPVPAAIPLRGRGHATARTRATLALLGLVAVVPFTISGPGLVNPAALDADLVADFQQRAERYMALHHTLRQDGRSPEQKSVDAGRTRVSRTALAGRIRLARQGARQGEMFTPAIAALLRRAMNPLLRGVVSADTRASIRDDGPAKFALHVSGAYPNGASLPTMPPNVLAILPSLPEGLEYRIVGAHLILRDVDADIVVDYLFDVMCATC